MGLIFTGAGRSFLDKIFGFDDARDDVREGQIEANKATKRGLSDFNLRADQAISTLAPDVGAGDDARESLLTSIGLRGREAQTQFFNNFQTDPGFQSEVDFGVDVAQSSAAARGGLFTGDTLKSLADFGQRTLRSAHQDRLDRLTGLARIGTDARQNTASVQVQQGNAAFGRGQLVANNAINTQNAIAGTRGGGINNLFAIGTQFAKAASGFGGAG